MAKYQVTLIKGENYSIPSFEVFFKKGKPVLVEEKVAKYLEGNDAFEIREADEPLSKAEKDRIAKARKAMDTLTKESTPEEIEAAQKLIDAIKVEEEKAALQAELDKITATKE